MGRSCDSERKDAIRSHSYCALLPQNAKQSHVKVGQFIKALAKAAIDAFYADISVLGEENVPLDGPLLAACNHWNMTVRLCHLDVLPLKRKAGRSSRPLMLFVHFVASCLPCR
jgi:1-acyl-sn-glycerol-3-phosphate acyltransferase